MPIPQKTARTFSADPDRLLDGLEDMFAKGALRADFAGDIPRIWHSASDGASHYLERLPECPTDDDLRERIEEHAGEGVDIERELAEEVAEVRDLMRLLDDGVVEQAVDVTVISAPPPMGAPPVFARKSMKTGTKQKIATQTICDWCGRIDDIPGQPGTIQKRCEHCKAQAEKHQQSLSAPRKTADSMTPTRQRMMAPNPGEGGLERAFFDKSDALREKAESGQAARTLSDWAGVMRALLEKLKAVTEAQTEGSAFDTDALYQAHRMIDQAISWDEIPAPWKEGRGPLSDPGRAQEQLGLLVDRLGMQIEKVPPGAPVDIDALREAEGLLRSGSERKASRITADVSGFDQTVPGPNQTFQKKRSPARQRYQDDARQQTQEHAEQLRRSAPAGHEQNVGDYYDQQDLRERSEQEQSNEASDEAMTSWTGVVKNVADRLGTIINRTPEALLQGFDVDALAEARGLLVKSVDFDRYEQTRFHDRAVGKLVRAFADAKQVADQLADLAHRLSSQIENVPQGAKVDVEKLQRAAQILQANGTKTARRPRKTCTSCNGTGGSIRDACKRCEGLGHIPNPPMKAAARDDDEDEDEDDENAKDAEDDDDERTPTDKTRVPDADADDLVPELPFEPPVDEMPFEPPPDIGRGLEILDGALEPEPPVAAIGDVSDLLPAEEPASIEERVDAHAETGDELAQLLGDRAERVHDLVEKFRGEKEASAPTRAIDDLEADLHPKKRWKPAARPKRDDRMLVEPVNYLGGPELAIWS